MNKNVTSRGDLLKTFSTIEKRFSDAKKDISTRDRKFMEALNLLISKLEGATVKLSSASLNTQNPLSQSLGEYVKTLEQSTNAWAASIQDHERGTTFRRQFDDSLLVFVYGKVKAGKSSLGNYIAWGHSDPTPEIVKTATPPYPQFNVHAQSGVKGGDKHNEAIQSKKFKVGSLEATSSIQTFSLPGFTWVDSPGIHSMHDKENGKLARDYVKSADLVVYAMQSQSPGRASDIEEIRGLLDDRKHLMILLTGSDSIEEDEDENQNIVSFRVMKSIQHRQQQVDYVSGEIKKIENFDKIISEVLPISVKYAEESSSDSEKLEDSGVSIFFDKLVQLANGEGLNMKLSTPINNLRAFGERLTVSQNELSNRLGEFDKTVQAEKNMLAKTEEFVISDIQRAIAAEIPLAIEKYRGDSEEYRKHLNKFMAKTAEARIKEEITSIFERMDVAISDFFDLNSVDGLPGFEKSYKKIAVSNKATRSAIGGGLLGVIGSGVGFIFGGIVGSLLGGMIGGAFGEKMGGHFSGDDIHQVLVGDNIADVEQSAHEIYSKAAGVLVKKVFSGSLGPVFDSATTFVVESRTALNNFNETVQEEVMQ